MNTCFILTYYVLRQRQWCLWTR